MTRTVTDGSDKIALLRKMPIPELRFRQKLANGAIRTVMSAGDPNNIVDLYRGQVRNINKILLEKIAKERKNGKPPSNTVQLKTAALGVFDARRFGGNNG